MYESGAEYLDCSEYTVIGSFTLFRVIQFTQAWTVDTPGKVATVLV